MKKSFQAKAKHHHVWGEYLRRWSPNNRDVYYTTAKGNIVCDSVKGFAMEKYFYKVRYLDDVHVAVIKKISSLSPDELQTQHIAYLGDFLKLQKSETQYIQNGVKIEEVEKLLYATKCNMLENLHSAHENETQEIIASLANRDLTILNEPENMMQFLQFFGHQITRTKNFKEKSISGFLKNKDETESNSSIISVMDECWWFLSYMLGMNIGADLYVTKKVDKHCLLLNETDTPFITSDQPIINVHESLRSDEIVPPNDDQCDFHYPLSPQVAYAINRSDRFKCGINHVTTNVVNEFNVKIAQKANVNIISSSETVLEPLLKHVGQRINKICL